MRCQKFQQHGTRNNTSTCFLAAVLLDNEFAVVLLTRIDGEKDGSGLYGEDAVSEIELRIMFSPFLDISPNPCHYGFRFGILYFKGVTP